MKIVLASQSPRRRELLSMMGISFEVAVQEVDESFPGHLNPVDAVRHIAEKKARAFMDGMTDGLVIAADTVVTIDNEILGKPVDSDHAKRMLQQLSGRKHDVITAVALGHGEKIQVFHDVTEVFFREIDSGEIDYYIDQFQPFDKAGAYGIQEWMGTVAIDRIEGSYTNVVGLPTQRLYSVLKMDFTGIVG